MRKNPAIHNGLIEDWRPEDETSAKASFSDQAVIFQRKHNWIMCWLYTGTFGSFIGFSAAFPIVLYALFPHAEIIR